MNLFYKAPENLKVLMLKPSGIHLARGTNAGMKFAAVY